MAPSFTVLPPTSISTAISLVRRSVVMMAWAASLEAFSLSDRAATRPGTPASMASMFSSTPMMPVEHTPKSWGCRPVAAAAAFAMRMAFSIPLGAQALALPLSRMTPWALWSAKYSMDRMTGSALTTFLVKVPAAVQGTSDRTMARSSLSGWGVVKLSFTPQCTPAALKPWGAVTPLEMIFIWGILLVMGWSGFKKSQRPSVSAKPSIRFMFWTAAPEAPLPRLSKTAVMVVWASLPQTVSRRWLVPTRVLE